jgi:hypothetical protein
MNPYLAEPGDLFACFGADNVSRFISWQTASPIAPAGLRFGPSHVAIASVLDDVAESCVWVESTTLTHRPCLVRGERVSGCQVHRISDRLQDYWNSGGVVDLYRLTPINALSKRSVRELSKDLGWYVSRFFGYDTASALFSGTHLIRAADKVLSLWRPDPQAVFCSQLIAGELQSLGLMNRDNPQRFNPGRLLRQLVAQGVYYRVGSLKDRT